MTGDMSSKWENRNKICLTFILFCFNSLHPRLIQIFHSCDKDIILNCFQLPPADDLVVLVISLVSGYLIDNTDVLVNTRGKTRAK